MADVPVMKTNGKMKKVGYGCIGFSVIVAILILSTIVDRETGISVMQFWAGVGITLLFGNASKNIVGGVQIAKQNGTK